MSLVEKRGTHVLGLLLWCASAVGAQTLAIRVENPTPVERRDETVAIGWASVRAAVPAAAPNRVRVTSGGTEVVSQVLDVNADGAPDSLLFQTSLFPREVRTFVVEAAVAVRAPSRAHVKFVPERTDVAWENDRVAFRTYGQLLWQLENLHTSGVDVWVKRTRELVLDKWYAGGHDFYHLDRGEGADFYSVGATLGGGALAIWRGGRMYRAENFKSYRILADGPIRLLFELDFDPWDAGGTRVTETTRVSMDAGQNVFRRESVFRAEGTDTLGVAVGFVKRPGLVGSTSRAQAWMWLSGWGPVTNKYGEGGHGDLGTAVLLDRESVSDVKELEGHYIAVTRARVGQPLVSYVAAGWTGSRDFAGVAQWWAYLDGYARRLDAPLRVAVGPAAMTH